MTGWVPGAREARRLAPAVAAGIAAASCAIGLAAVAPWLIATAARHPAVSTLAVAVVAVRAFGIGRGVLRYAERLAGHDAVLRQLAGVRARIVAHLADLVPAGAPELRSGDLTTRLVRDVDAVADRTLRVRLPGLVAAAIGVMSTVAAVLIFPPVAVALVAGFAMVTLVAPAVAAWVARRGSDLERQVIAPRRGAYAAAVTQTLHGAADLIAFDAAGDALERLAAADLAVARASRRSAWGQGMAAAIAVLAAGLVPACALWWGVPAVTGSRLGLPMLAVVTLAPLALYEVLAPLVPAATLLPEFRASQARLDDIEARPLPVTDPGRPAGVPEPPYVLEVENLAVRWPGGQARPAFEGLTFSAATGQRVAVVGPSGSGKSTVAAALMRFIDPEAGAIRINGTDLRSLRGDDVRRLIGLCAQDAYLFDSTVAENVRLARTGATDEDIREALDHAGLGAWLATLPDGIDTRIGEHGARLSAGQRQRVSLARILLAAPPIVILDEPTEHLDEPTATALFADLLEATKGAIVVVMTHRKRDLRFVDSVHDLSELSDESEGSVFADVRAGH